MTLSVKFMSNYIVKQKTENCYNKIEFNIFYKKHLYNLRPWFMATNEICCTDAEETIVH